MKSREAYIEPTERRVCTVLFADIVKSTELIGDFDDPEEAMSRLGPGVETIMRCCEEFGANVTFTGDGAMAVFGYPYADEDHVIKAVDCACTLIRQIGALTEDSVEVRVGIHTGEILIGNVRHARSTELTFSGLVLHVARKIEELARPNLVTVSRQVIEAVGDLFDHDVAQAAALATKAGQVALYEVTGRNEGVSRWDLRARHGLTPLEGRSAELAALSAAWDGACRGQGAAVRIVGAPGIGKSRLVHEFTSLVAEGGHQVLEIRCDSLDRGASYAPVARALAERMEADRAEPDGGALQAEFERVLDEAGDMAGPIRKAIAGTAQTDPAPDGANQTSPAHRRQILVDALTRILLGLSGGAPLLLSVEDVHWADRGTQDVLARLIERATEAHVLVVVTTRDGGAFDEATESRLETIPLAQLEAASCRRIIGHLLAEYASDAALTEFVEALSDRTPLFMEEIARQVRRRLTDVPNAGGAVARGALSDMEIPTNVQPLIVQRIDGLDAEDRKVLLAAAACGIEMRRSILMAVCDRAGLAGEPAIARLVSEGFLTVAGGGAALRFGHALLQSVAYRGMPRMRRAAMHQEIYAAILAQPDAEDDRLAQVRAYQAGNGQLWLEATREYIRCAEVSMGVFAFETAMANYERAQECLDAASKDTDPAIVAECGLEIRRGLRVSVLPSGDMRRILDIAREVEALAESIGDERARISAQFDQAIMLTILSNTAEAIRNGRAALGRAKEIGEKGLVANAAFALAQAAWFAGDYSLVKEAVDEHEPLYLNEFRTSNLGTTGTVSVLALATRANAGSLTGAFEAAEIDVARCMEIAEATGKAYDRCFALTAKGLLQLAQGAYPESAESLAAGLAHAEESRIDVLRCFASAPYARALAHLGRIEKAHEVLRFGRDIAERMQMPAFETWLATAQVLVELRDGRAGEAAELASDVIALSRSYGYAGFAALVQADMAVDAAAAGRATPGQVTEARRACTDAGMTAIARKLDGL